MLDQSLFVDIRPSSAIDLWSEAVDELIVKARKPYTLTKLREKWTEEEHEKFLEALKLYGRAWRRIQDRIGTKTAVQIRSHAQKFFSKVVREHGTDNTIEIPPARPKRKPLHPYPRKLAQAYPKGVRVMDKQDRSSSPVPSVSGQESGSQVSVLSAVGSNNMGSPASNHPYCCTSQLSAVVGSGPFEPASSEQEPRCCSPAISGVEQNGSSSASLASNSLIKHDVAPMETDPGSQNKISSKEVAPSEGQSTTLKLFGTTLLVSNSKEVHSSTAGNPQCSNDNIARHEKTTDGHEHSCWFPNRSTWSLWHTGVPPPTCCSTADQNSASSKSTVASLHAWRIFYGNSSISSFNQPSKSSEKELPQKCTVLGDDNAQKECSSTGLSSVHERTAVLENSNRNAVALEGYELLKEPTHTFRLNLSESSACTGLTMSSNKPCMGFMPYKRCLEENQVQKPPIANNGEDIRLCL